MIEGLREQGCDYRVGSLVLGVTRAAKRRRARGKLSVKAERGLDVAANRFVAFEAEIVFGTPIEALMTGAAVLRFTLMRGDERAGGHQALDVHGVSGGRDSACGCKDNDGGEVSHAARSLQYM